MSGSSRQLREFLKILQFEGFGLGDGGAVTGFDAVVTKFLSTNANFVRFLAAFIVVRFELLRNEATVNAETLGAALAHFDEAVGEDALLCGLITEVEVHRFFGGLLLGRGAFEEEREAVVFKAHAAAREPEGFGHLMDDLDFLRAFWLFGFEETSEEFVVFGLRFACENFKCAGKTVPGGVLGAGGFTLFGGGAGGELGIGAIGVELGVAEGKSGG